MFSVFISGCHSGAVVSTLASQQEGSGFESSLGAFYVLPVQMYEVRLMGDPKLPVGAGGRFCIRFATRPVWVWGWDRPVAAGMDGTG